MKTMLFALVLASSVSAFAAETAPTKAPMDPAKKEELKMDRDAVNSSCTNEAATAGCGSEQVGTGLLKCIHAYKQTHKEFKVSDGCKTAMHKLHADKTTK
jgi:hypothetical protein